MSKGERTSFGIRDFCNSELIQPLVEKIFG